MLIAARRHASKLRRAAANQVDKIGYTPLLLAAHEGHAATAAVLLRARASVDQARTHHHANLIHADYR